MSSRRSSLSKSSATASPRVFGAAFSSARSHSPMESDEMTEAPNHAFSYMKPTDKTTEPEGPWNWTTTAISTPNAFDDHLDVAPEVKAQFADAKYMMRDSSQKRSTFEENNASILGLDTSSTIVSLIGAQKVSFKRDYDSRTELRDRHGNYIDGRDRGKMQKRYETEWNKRLQGREEEMLRANEIWMEWQTLSDEQKTERRAQASRDRELVLQSLEIDEEEEVPETYDHQDIWREVRYFTARKALQQPLSTAPSTVPLTEESSVGDLFINDDDSITGPPAEARSTISSLFAESSISHNDPYQQFDNDSNSVVSESWEGDSNSVSLRSNIPDVGAKSENPRVTRRGRRFRKQRLGTSSLPREYSRRDEDIQSGSGRNALSSNGDDLEEPTRNVKVWHSKPYFAPILKQPPSQALSQKPISAHKFVTWPSIIPPEDIEIPEVPQIEYINDQAQIDHLTEISNSQGRLVTVELTDANVEYSSGAILDRVFGGTLQEVQFFPRVRQAVLVFLHPSDALAFVKHVECAARHSAHEYRRLQVGCAWYKGPINSAIWPAQEKLLTFAIVETCSRVLLVKNISERDSKDVLLEKFKALFVEQHIVKAKLVAPKKNYEKDKEKPNAVILEFGSIKQAIAAKATLAALSPRSPFEEFKDCRCCYLSDSVSKPATRMPWCNCSHCKSPPRSRDVRIDMNGEARGGDVDSFLSYETVLSGSAFIRAAKTLQVDNYNYETQHDARLPAGWEKRFASHSVKSGSLHDIDEE